MKFTLRSLLILVAAIGCFGCHEHGNRWRVSPEARAKMERETQELKARWAEEAELKRLRGRIESRKRQAEIVELRKEVE